MVEEQHRKKVEKLFRVPVASRGGWKVFGAGPMRNVPLNLTRFLIATAPLRKALGTADMNIAV